MPIPPKSLAAFASKKKASVYNADEDTIDEVDAEEPDDADKEEDDAEEEAEDEGEIEEVDAVAIGEQVQNGEWPDEELMAKAKGVNEENNPPSWALDEDIWEKAKAAVEDKWDEYDEPFAVVSAVYQKMGGGIE